MTTDDVYNAIIDRAYYLATTSHDVEQLSTIAGLMSFIEGNEEGEEEPTEELTPAIGFALPVYEDEEE